MRVVPYLLYSAAAQLHGQADERAPLLNGHIDHDQFVTPIDSPAGRSAVMRFLMLIFLC